MVFSQILKSCKNFAKKLYFKDKKFPVKVRDIHKIEIKNSISIKEKHLIFVSKNCCEEKRVDLLLINIFLSKISRHSCIIILSTIEKNHFRCYCLWAFNPEEILKCHIKDCFKINGQQKIIIPKKGKYVQFNNFEEKSHRL